MTADLPMPLASPIKSRAGVRAGRARLDAGVKIARGLVAVTPAFFPQQGASHQRVAWPASAPA